MLSCRYDSLTQRKAQIKKPYYLQNHIDFEFPPASFRYLKFQQIRYLNDTLLRLGLKTGFPRGRLFNRKDHEKITGKKIIYACKERNCPAKMQYHWNGVQVYCEKYDNVHYHKKSSNLQKLKRQCIQLFILDMPLGENWENFRKWIYRFDIGEKDAKYLVEQYFWYNNTEDEIFSRLAFQGKTLRRIKDEDGNTVLVFICTETMKKNYRMYGDSINFDSTYKMLKKTNPYGSHYGVGHFLAQDTNLRLTLVAVCLFAKDCKEYFKYIFTYFFDLVAQGHIPNSIATDDLPPLTQALEQIKVERGYQFLHIFDWFHVTENLRAQLKNQPKGPYLFSLFCKCLGQTYPGIYNYYLKRIHSFLQNSKILEEFIAKDYRYSICKLPPKFISFSILYRYSRLLNHRINTCTVFDSYAGRFFFTLLHMEKILQRYLQKVTVINAGLIKHIQYQEIHLLTIKIQNQVMEKLVKYFTDSLDENMKLQKISDIMYKIMYEQEEEEDQEEKREMQRFGDDYDFDNGLLKQSGNNSKPLPIYYVRFSLQFQHWDCSCRLQYINGLPCCHIIRVLREKQINGSLQYYIHARWFHDKQDRIPEFSKPLITRRRRRM